MSCRKAAGCERLVGSDPSCGRHHVVKEGGMNSLNWNGIIQALVLIRIGQELGTDSRLARALHEVVQALMFAWR